MNEVDEKLSKLAANLRARAKLWSLDMSENRNKWTDILEALADDIESCISSTNSTDEDPSPPPRSQKSHT